MNLIKFSHVKFVIPAMPWYVPSSRVIDISALNIDETGPFVFFLLLPSDGSY
jgi:hypothetical protein